MDLSNKNIVHVVKNGIEYLQFRKLLEYPNLIHAYTLKPLDFRVRHFQNGEKVPLAYETIFHELGMDINTLVRPNQTHTSNVLMINEKQKKDEPDIFIERLDNIDGLITKEKKIALASTSADCIVLFFFDPVKQVIASVHSGWRGTFQKISQVTVRKMKSEVGCNPEDIIVCICPSIRVCHFEVDEDVKKECELIFSYTGRLDEIIHQGMIKDGKQKYNIDTVLITKILLETEGILPYNIIDSKICSVCSSEKVHSRRADGEGFGLGAGIIQMKLRLRDVP